MIDPEIWDDEKFNSLCRDARLLFIGIFNLADDEGRIDGSARYLRKRVFGYDLDITPEQVESLLQNIIDKRMAVKYTIGECNYLWIPKFKKYQTISHPSPSRIPPPNGQKSFGDLQDTSQIFRKVPEDSHNTPDDSGEIEDSQKLNVRTYFPESSGGFSEDSPLISIDKFSLVKDSIDYIYAFWNSSKIVEHKKCTERMTAKIKSALKDYTLEEISQSISNYAEILHNKEYWWNYTWSLDDFLARGIEKFKNIDMARSNYKGEKPKSKTIGNKSTYKPKVDVI